VLSSTPDRRRSPGVGLCLSLRRARPGERSVPAPADAPCNRAANPPRPKPQCPLPPPLWLAPTLGAPIYSHPVDIKCLGNGGVCKSLFKQDAHARIKSFVEAGGVDPQVPHGLYLQKWSHLPARRRTRELEEPTASRQSARLLFAIFVPPRIGVRLRRCQPSAPRKSIPALIVVRCHPMFGGKMKGKTPKPFPTKQTFDRLAAKIAFNLAACSKKRRLLCLH